MVPHGRVEESLLATLRGGRDPSDEPTELAVTAVEDERRGEELVVLHTGLDVPIDTLLAGLREGPLPPLFHPRARNFVEVDELPVLGSGKLDLKELKRVAGERLGSSAPDARG